MSAWQIFLRDNLKEDKKDNNKLSITTLTKEYGQKWRSLSEHEKQTYVDKYQNELKAHKEGMEAALSSASPKQISDENALRKKYKLETIQDPKMPKKPMNSFMVYCQHLRAINDPTYSIADVTLRMKEVGKKYRELTPDELQVFIDRAKDESCH